jgi:hypothetical protein
MLIIRLSQFIIRKVIQKKSSLPTRAIPLLIELSDNNNISVEHVYSMCTTAVETQVATIAIQVVMVIFRIGKYRPKSRGKR